MTTPVVKLDRCERWLAQRVGQARLNYIEEYDRKHYGGAFVSAGAGRHIAGASAELAVAKYLCTYWHAFVEPPQPADVGHRVQVRTTPHLDGHLYNNKRDDPGAAFVLVIALGGDRYRLAGWILGADAQQAKYWGDIAGQDRPVYWVPQCDLADVETVPAECR